MNLDDCITSQWFQDQAVCRIDSESQFARYHSTLGDGDIVYSRYWAKFFDRFHHRMLRPYVLLSNFHDAPIDRIPDAVSDPKLLHWFGVNMAVEHAKMTPIPLAVTASSLRVMREISPDLYRVGGYLNCSPSTKERQELYRQPAAWIKEPHDKHNLRRYFNQVASAEYVICPRGNGQDTYRVWEVLALGARPVVKSSFLDRLYREAGAAIVNDWNDSIPAGTIDQRIIHKTYWRNRLMTFKTRVA